MPSAPKPTSRLPAFVSRSKKLETDYLVFAEMVGARASSSEPLPVVVVVDGDYMFEPLVDAAKALHRENKIRGALLAGVGYGKPFGSPLNKRGRDYTTSAGEEEPESGGAQLFLEHLTGPLWTELRRHCRIKANNSPRVIAGHSLGGLFALHAFFQAEAFFDGAIAGAPSLWWDGHRYLKQLAAFREKTPSLARRSRLFLGIGEDDTESMTADFARFERQLASAPFGNLEVISKKFPGHDHYDLLPSLFRAALSTLL